jgi:hypothetical protein
MYSVIVLEGFRKLSVTTADNTVERGKEDIQNRTYNLKASATLGSLL